MSGEPTTAKFSYPAGITLVGSSLYVADKSNASIRYVSTSSGTVFTVAGNGIHAKVDGNEK